MTAIQHPINNYSDGRSFPLGSSVRPNTDTIKNKISNFVKDINDRVSLTWITAVACGITYAYSSMPGSKLMSLGAQSIPKIMAGQYWRIGTAPFLHCNLLHLGVNVSVLLNDGPTIEQRWGKLGFVALTIAAVAADVFVKIVLNSRDPSIGFSGVLFAMSGALLVIKTPTGLSLDQNVYRFITGQIIFGIVAEQLSRAQEIKTNF